jgi:Spy/CpxP family protein refolding chaperone
MKRFSALLIPLALTLGACDTDEQVARSGDAPEDTAALEHPNADEADPHPGDHHRFRGPGMMIDRLCGELDCTADQRAEIEDLARDLRPEGPFFKDRGTAQRAVADAFRAETLDTEALRTQVRSFEKHADVLKGTMTDALVGLHGILTPEQRAAAADIIEKRGPMFMRGHGKHGKHGKHVKHGKHGKRHAKGAPDMQARADHMVERLCEKVSCTGDQAAQIKAAVTERRTADKAEHGAVGEKLAAAFRSDSFGPEEVQVLIAAKEEKMRTRAERHLEKVAAVHALLTPDQRAVIADEIAEHGPRGFMGGHGGHGRGHHRK